MSLLPQDKERLVRYIDFLESELSDFPKFSKIDWRSYNEDKDLRRNLERWIENLVNCSIDIGKVLLVAEDRRTPSTYRQVLKELGATKYFDEEFGSAISQWCSLRNILAHEYLDVRWNSVRDFVQSAEPAYRELVDKIKPLLLS